MHHRPATVTVPVGAVSDGPAVDLVAPAEPVDVTVAERDRVELVLGGFVGPVLAVPEERGMPRAGT
jgi:hypothetical protein